jgi:SH3-like domain-containing protein
MKVLIHAAWVFLALISSGKTCAAEFMSVAAPAIIYDAQSLKANKIFVASRYYPFEVMVKLSGWVKVRDSLGDMGWVESKNLSDKRTVIVNAAQAEAYVGPDISTSVAFVAERNVVMEPLEAANNGWLKVKHRDGQIGFVKIDQIWGN